ncbi:hypothetical protein [Brevundimonas diminuta]|uniref:Uncharacterized protein n=1 Tax=Brevundimonas diminuta TaxID=293 RepID=A0A410NU14_BREDI|nr:hypothetical protein [Brevundimonas diminuta]MBD3817916.1 hypothetical protein [Brevundimonas diminuta]QAT13342.1 hypothetical protein EQG53_02650 [Brevundimonas diminuta]QAT13879.1 hypothetical protein EQG53_05615 [Brevundimonas diminuta]QQB88755.1 hypothetical protein I6H83_16810 [Brevundimonas diminuta]QQB89296.1 hypothetical protein I6H83_02300 [Brevundimonas diminuta]
MKLYALDTVQITSVKSPDPLLAGEAFEIDDEAVAKQLIDRGLASEKAPGEKAAPPPKNKAEPAPSNKAESKPQNKADA